MRPAGRTGGAEAGREELAGLCCARPGTAVAAAAAEPRNEELGSIERRSDSIVPREALPGRPPQLHLAATGRLKSRRSPSQPSSCFLSPQSPLPRPLSPPSSPANADPLSAGSAEGRGWPALRGPSTLPPGAGRPAAPLRAPRGPSPPASWAWRPRFNTSQAEERLLRLAARRGRGRNPSCCRRPQLLSRGPRGAGTGARGGTGAAGGRGTAFQTRGASPGQAQGGSDCRHRARPEFGRRTWC